MDLVTEDRERPRGADVAAEMAASGALDDVFARIDSGDLELTGDGGFIPGLIKAALERGLQAELTGHRGYWKGAPEAAMFANSRNGTTSKTLASQVGMSPWTCPAIGTACSSRGWSRRARGGWADSMRSSSASTRAG
jgi:putative transposase